MSPVLHSLVAKHGQCVACQSLNTGQQLLHLTAACQYSRTFSLHITSCSRTDTGQRFYNGAEKTSPQSKDSAADDDDVQMG